MHRAQDNTRCGASLERRISLLGATAATSFLLLIGLVVAWEGWLAPAGYGPPGMWVVIKTVPLLVPLRGLLRGRPSTHLWASLLVLAYFVEGVVIAFAERSPGLLVAPSSLALVQTLLCVVFFCAALFYVRLSRQRAVTDRRPNP